MVLEVDSRGVVKATGNLDIFKKKAAEAEKSATSLDSIFNKFNLSAIASAGGCLALVSALNNLLTGFSSIAKQAIQTYSRFESMQKGLETFFQSAEKGKATFEMLRKYSNETTFGVDELANASTQLLNVGVSENSLVETLGMIGDIAGGNKQKFAELVSIFSKVQATGKAGTEQIQQLALRGVPIYDMLKKIGVTGTATASDITQAFKAMTDEGGQFYNAMNNINDTIEGKEGFINDYFNEMLVNFAEVTGLADIYKVILDTLKDAIGNISDALLSMNEQPVAKALLQGSLVSALTLVIALIGVSLVTGVKALNAQLTKTVLLKSILDPKTLGLALAVGAIAGVTVAVASVANELKNVDDRVTDLKNHDNVAISDIKFTQTEHEGDLLSNIKTAEDKIKLFRDGFRGEGFFRTGAFLGIDELTSLIEKIEATGADDSNMNLNDLKKQKKELEDEIDKQQRVIDSNKKSLEIIKEVVNEEKAAIAFLNEIQRARVTINSEFENSSIGKKLQEIGIVEAKLKEVKDLINKDSVVNYLSTEEVDKSNLIIDELENKLRKLNGLAEKKTWREYWKEVTGAYIGDVEIKKMSGWQIGKVTSAQYSKNIEKSAYAASFTGGSKSSVYLSGAENVNSMINDLLSKTGLSDEEFYARDNAVRSLKLLQKELLGAGEASMTFAEKLNGGLKTLGLSEIQNGTALLGSAADGDSMDNAVEVIKNGYGHYAKGAALGAAVNTLGDTDAGTFMQSWINTGNVFLAIIETVIGGFMKVLASIEGFEDGLNGVTDFFERLKPILEIIVDIGNTIVDGVDDLLDIIDVVVEAFTPLFQIIQIIVKVLQVPLKIIGILLRSFVIGLEVVTDALEYVINGIDWFLGILDSIFGKEEDDEEEKEQAVDLTDAYKALLNAMKENQEFYEERKRQLNATNYANDVTGVHDMILTPQGNFSTDPDDYIIATKNPGALNGGGSGGVVILQPVIENYAADKVDVKVSQNTDENGLTNFLVMVSQKVANDYANGNNGWENAIAYQKYKSNGRSLVM